MDGKMKALLPRRILSVFVVSASLAGCASEPKQAAKTNTQISEAVLNELIDGNPTTLTENVLPQEQEQLALTEQKVRETYRTIVQPVFSKTKRDGHLETIVNSFDLSATTNQKIRGPGMTPCSVGMTAFMTESGPRVSFIDALNATWIAKYSFTLGRAVSGSEKRLAVLKGLRQDKDKLLAAGITKLMRNMPGEKAVSIDEYEAALNDRIKSAGRQTASLIRR